MVALGSMPNTGFGRHVVCEVIITMAAAARPLTPSLHALHVLRFENVHTHVNGLCVLAAPKPHRTPRYDLLEELHKGQVPAGIKRNAQDEEGDQQ